MPAIDVTEDTFQTEVLDKSMEVPVVVDLWAEWCGPCKTLGPILDKVIDATNGKVVLAKIDVDANPALSEAFKVQSIPAVYAMKNGAVVDGFMGAYPESAVQEFVDKLLPADDAEPTAVPEASEVIEAEEVVEEFVPDDDYDAVLTELLGRVKADDEARQQFVDILETMGADDPRTAGYRKQLTRELF